MSTSIVVSPSSSAVDDTVSVVISGLAPSSRVSVRSRVQDRDKVFQAVGHFVADRHGSVDLATQESLGGSYTGLEPMGLFWSMGPAPGQNRGIRYVKQDVREPAEFTFAVYQGHLDLPAIGAACPVAVTKTCRWYIKESEVDRIKVHSGKVRGVLYKPIGPGPFPAVIDMFGLAGVIIDYRAAMLATRGFVALALPFMGYEDLPQRYNELDFEYFEETAEWLSSQPYVSPGGVGVVGSSFGGCVALEMAARLPQIKAVVALSCLPYFKTMMTYRGDKLPSSHPAEEQADIQKAYMSNVGLVMKDIFLHDICSLPDEELVQVHQSKAQFLFAFGEYDLSIPAVESAQRMVQVMRSHNKNNYEFLRYPRAGHLLEPPFHPVGRGFYNNPMGRILDFGGEMKPTAHACQDVWLKTLSFLRKHLRTTGAVEGHQHTSPAGVSKL